LPNVGEAKLKMRTMQYFFRSVLTFVAIALCLGQAHGQYGDYPATLPYPVTSTPYDPFSGPVFQQPMTAALPALNPYSELSPAPTDATYVELLPQPELVPSEGAEASESIEILPEDHFEITEDQVIEHYQWYDPFDLLARDRWKIQMELGLNGSTGSNEAFSINSGGKVRRKTEFTKFVADATYNKTTAGGAETQNNANLDLRNDWRWANESRWSVFALGTLFYDEFQPFDLQVNANSGIGYQFVDKDWLDLTSRIGSGMSREFGGPTDRWVPEATFGIDGEYQVTRYQSISGKVEYYPEWEQLNEFRLVTELGWEIEFVEPSNMSLKILASDRYDSTPNDTDPQILNYSVLMIWKL
jgi:putative salt-induced outer membrane protein YdiY